MSRSGKLPGYAANLLAYHRAFEADLQAMLADVPLRAGQRVLDVASGDGAYSRWLTERGADVVAVDFSDAFLGLAKREIDRDDGVPEGSVGLIKGDIKRLPFPDDGFDLVWCAQSLYSLPDPTESVTAMRKIVKPGGCVAVLENDEFHHVLLPWPVEIELALRHAEMLAFIETSDKPRKFYIGRRLRRVFRAAGLTDFHRVSRTIDRQAPLDEGEKEYFATYLADLREQVRGHLGREVREEFEALVDPGSSSYMLDDPDFTVTCVNYVAWAVKDSKP